MGYLKYVKEAWKKPDKKTQRERYVVWRKEPRFHRLERPTRIDRARGLGYKAKEGFIVVRARIGKGGRKRPKVGAGRKPKKSGVFYTPGKSQRLIAEERVQRKYPNLEILNSYWVGDDGKSKFFEIILVDPQHPQVRADKDVNWIVYKQHTRRVNRGLSGAGKKTRGLRKKGIGAEKVRPSVRANKGRTN